MQKQSSTPQRLVMGGIVVGLAILVALFLRGAGDPDRPAGAPTVASTARARIRTPAPSISLTGKPPGTIEPPALMDDEVLESIVKKDKKLGLFMGYYKTVLPDEHTRDEYRKLLSDPAMMTAMAQDLMDPGTGHPASTEYYRRLMLVDYFDAALTWKDNPQRQKLLELTRDIITKDNFGGDQDGTRRQVLGGTKMELYRLLYAQDAQKAGELVAQAKGTRMEPLLNWMAEEELRRRTREKEILKEGDELVRSN
ncbi:MAG TPA: hypothetical protein VFT22_38120 [Kofleriaceae bacterium]|nr:hypothetical protein [Kofleriaceae bacterium]